MFANKNSARFYKQQERKWTKQIEGGSYPNFLNHSGWTMKEETKIYPTFYSFILYTYNKIIILKIYGPKYIIK
jgi:hypothetical protein